MEKAEFVAVKIPSSLKKELEEMARQEGLTLSDVVRKAIDLLLKRIAEFTPMGTVEAQKLIVATYAELMIELYHQRLLLYAILNELRKDLSPELKHLFDETREELKKLIDVRNALELDDWRRALATLLEVWRKRGVRA